MASTQLSSFVNLASKHMNIRCASVHDNYISLAVGFVGDGGVYTKLQVQDTSNTHNVWHCERYGGSFERVEYNILNSLWNELGYALENE